MPAIRNNKQVYTTSLSPEVLNDFKDYCYENKLKMNHIIEALMIEYLKVKKND